MTEPAALPLRPRIRLPRIARWIKGVMVAGALLGTGLGVLGGIMFRTYRQPSGSMWPTLQIGERLIANRLPAPPERGSVVVFKYPEHPDQSFVKRIVGLPGDVVAVTKGEVSINGWNVPRCVVGKTSYVEGGETGDSAAKHEGTFVVEYLGDATYLVFEQQETTLEAPGEGHHWTVAPGQYFVLGDNRNNSHDSRMWFGGAGGGVPFASTQGRVRGHRVPEIPPNAENAGGLAGALAGCLAKRPAETVPPAPR